VLAARLRRLVAYDAVAVYVLQGEKLRPAYVTGADYNLFSSLAIPLGQGLSGWVADNRKPIINGNPSVEPGYLNDVNKFSTLNSALAVPLLGASGVVGVLTIYHRAPDFFSSDQLRILLAIGAKLAVSIENALKYEQAESSATTDYLTGLPNARSLFVHLEGEISRCQREGAALTVLVCDLDGFKQVNDQFGHLTGNKVLGLMAARMQEACRSYDYVARMGGDEFVLVLPGMAREALPERVRVLTGIAEESGLEACGQSMVSVSIGAAAFPSDGRTSEDLLAEADRRMYKNKSLKRLASSRESLRSNISLEDVGMPVPARKLRLLKPA
jgi:diguanylate cyclase (GGDEF)-like protein